MVIGRVNDPKRRPRLHVTPGVGHALHGRPHELRARRRSLRSGAVEPALGALGDAPRPIAPDLVFDQFTNSLRFFSAAMRTFLLAGFALNIIFSPLKGFTPSRAFVAGFFPTFLFRSPGIVNKP